MKGNKHPIVAIIGRPNVGKSTLFNRILGRRMANVYDKPGLTRDRNYCLTEWSSREFLMVDTGGYEIEDSDILGERIREQVRMSIEEADAIIFLMEVQVSDNPTDAEILRMLRKSQKPFFTAVNKCDTLERTHEAWELSSIGVGEIYPVSASHGLGIGDLLDDLVDALPEKSAGEVDVSDEIRIAVVGRQNVGKSTLVNRILGEERVIAAPVAGTTRDAIDTPLKIGDKNYLIIDTAGIRRRGKVERGPEHLSVTSSIMSIERCDIAVLILDAVDGITAQDTHVAGYIQESGKAVIILVNKWDAIEKEDSTAGTFAKNVSERFDFLPFAPILFASALTGQRVKKIFDLIEEIIPQYRAQFSTSDLNRVLKEAVTRHQPPVRKGKQLKIKYITQTRTAPPTLMLFVNNPQLMHFSYKRYLKNQFAERLGLDKAPLRLRLRRK